MAEDSGQDKTEDPTGKRLSESRKKGQIPRSKELNTFVTLITSSALFFYFGQGMWRSMLEMMKHPLQLSREAVFDPATPLIYLKAAFAEGLWVILPFLVVLVVADLAAAMMLGGWNFTSEAFEMKFSKLNPLTGIKKIIGIQGLVELVKAIIKTILVAIVSWNLFKLYFDDFMGLSRLPLDQAIHHVGDIISFCLVILSATFLLLVMLDAPYQLWNHQRQLKMTKQEVRDEAKDQEGNPEVKGKIRRMQMEAAQRRMMDAVPSADVIVTNPTHFAVALKYDQNGNGAPLLVAKGTDLVAAQIRQLAMASQVPLVAAPSLARALYYSTDLNQEIPRGLFLAVAQVLAYVFQLRASTQYGWNKPVPPTDVQVPDDFKQ
ncbi:flagellar biosynthesis protein FlhB [Methylomonas sp. BW4-1]|uniref:flagellar biosynthesis protein FlhB n=1 Tax=unclassified Methylomonas TaxID=2608980 RepID=UPI0019670D3B|nr:flagellar biosynthesis protein FlhB [Methylomonas sp. EFPC1]QSB00978.1 flagellar biosynthesis protein FlhB [Methylomonas sp. EFPC1]